MRRDRRARGPVSSQQPWCFRPMRSIPRPPRERSRSRAQAHRRSSCRSVSAMTRRRGSSAAQSSSTRRAAARRRGRIFARYDSLEAKLGAAFAAWPGTEDRVEQLGALYPRSALVQLHVGLARLWAGTGDAGTAWREARDVEPDTPYAVWADDLIHPELAPGLPIFTPSFPYRVRRRHAGGTARGAAGRPQSAWPADLRDRVAAPRPARLRASCLRRSAAAGAEQRRRTGRRRGRAL